MAKFKAGDMITDGTFTFLVNRVIVVNNKYSVWNGKETYSLDNGDGFTDARDLASSVDAEFKLFDYMRLVA
jgi:hypothetical protein